MLSERFFIAKGTVIGYKHRDAGKNNQDGVCVCGDEENLLAVVSDGCSSSANSEVGAKLISKYVAEEGLRLLKSYPDLPKQVLIKRLEKLTIGFFEDFVNKFGNPYKVVDEMLLATVMGLMMNNDSAVVFSSGDGMFSLNGDIFEIDENNLPSYLGYKIIPGSYEIEEDKINFVIRKEISTEEIKSLIIATDGAKDLEEKADFAIRVLGREEIVGGLNQFEAERYKKNPSLVQKRLFQLNRERIAIDWTKRETEKFGGVLSDDTTIVLIKRRE